MLHLFAVYSNSVLCVLVISCVFQTIVLYLNCLLCIGIVCSVFGIDCPIEELLGPHVQQTVQMCRPVQFLSILVICVHVLLLQIYMYQA